MHQNNVTISAVTTSIETDVSKTCLSPAGSIINTEDRENTSLRNVRFCVILIAWEYISARHVLMHTYFFMARQPLGGLGRLIFRGFTITLFRHTTLGRTPLDE
jgi:hypothetical protein